MARATTHPLSPPEIVVHAIPDDERVWVPPALGVEVTADFELDVTVRFDTDHMAVTIESYRLHNWQQIPIVELRT
jgi:uncharacterized protein (TIGR02217 family)